MSGAAAGTGRVEDGGVVAAARAGDQAAFGGLVEAYRRELQVHCYRLLGSFEESQDLVQETFLRAWRRRETYEGRSTFRAWLYRIATNACLDFLDRHPRRPRLRQPLPEVPGSRPQQPPPAMRTEVWWLQPFPDHLLEGVAADDAEPHDVVVAKETIELAFLVAIQHLPPRQRAVLILRDVLGWPAPETATLLETSVPAVKSALQRARATLKEHLPPHRDEWAPSADPSEAERDLLRRYVHAHEQADPDAITELLREDVQQTMPPHPLWFVGRDLLAAFAAQVFDPASPWYHGRWRSLPTRANRQPAVAHYVTEPRAAVAKDLPGTYRAQVLDVLRIEDGKVAEITSFEPHLFPAFGLPLTL